MLHPSAHKILKAIDQFWKENHYAPSIQDVEIISGVGPRSNVLHHFRNLKETGFVLYDEGVARSVRTPLIDQLVQKTLEKGEI